MPLPLNIEQLVTKEVTEHYDRSDLMNMTFDSFWEEIEALNVYEEEWSEHVAAGIRGIYRKVFYNIITGVVK
jgi:hypothetical protein